MTSGLSRASPWRAPGRRTARGRYRRSFGEAILTIGYQVVPLSGRSHQKVVDIAMQGLEDGRRIGLMGFTELVNSGFRDLPSLEVFDLEHDVKAFNVRLPRVRIIPIEELDPLDFL